MEKSKVDMIAGMYIEYFDPQQLMAIREKLEQMDDSKAFLMQGADFQKPSTILLIAVLLGWERFWLDDMTMGVLKVITAYGCGIWWLIDIFSAKRRAMDYNFNKFNKLFMM